ncbi:hypothetical protein HN51_006639 [Arachis hypogaea]|uniref:Transmembrane protein n=2 Tax=Arachis TaxID=3817 RepID=A0A444WUB5_ARAHY|nr:uncharacterized protein LOC107487643 [Arachis duranensis]XP_025698560.1 uncharacterized protein LOC112800476 [Arachis hypogaea]QHO40598.1 Nuclear envelope integral membrane protein [Arachis hypogaea]RYQ80975.1 hypothetical protein Ahy_Scaffold1g107019 isoform A [Arachis hypogaea]
MAGTRAQHAAPFAFLLLLLCLWASAVLVLADEHSLCLNQNSTLQLSRGFPVGKSPGSKPGVTVVVERVRIRGLSRFRNLSKFAHSMKVKVLPADPNVRIPNIEICFHRNASLAVGMCSQGQWEKVTKGSWVRSMSPFDHKLLDIRTAGSTLENFEVSVEEEFFAYRVVLLILGITLMSLASFLSKSLAFYYSSAMAVGVILVILMILYQGMKLLPTGRKSSLGIFIYSSAIGFGTFLLRYVPGLIRAVLTELGIDEDMYNPLAIFLLAFVTILGAWLGFWVVRKLVLTEDGSVDISTAQFVVWAIRILAAVMILQSSMDPLLGALALLCGSLVNVMKRALRSRFLRRMRRSMFKSPKKNRRRSQDPDSSPFDNSNDGHAYNMQSKEDSTFLQRPLKSFTLSPCKSSERVFTRTPPKKLTEDLFPSIIHNTPERRKYSAAEWDAFTKESTEKALEELVSSPDFSKWLSTNADRITVTPNSRNDEQRTWQFWS